MATKNTPSFLKRSALSATVFFGTLIVLSAVYAAYQTVNSSEYTPGAPMTSTLMGKIVGNIDSLNTRLTSMEGNGGITPVGAVMAFNLAACPTGWSAADGTGGRPDLRGEFVRWLDNGRGVDAGRILGSSQIASQLALNIYSNGSNGYPELNGIEAAQVSFPPMGTSLLGDGWVPQASGVAGASVGISQQFNGGAGGVSLRSRNIALLYCIKN